MPVAPDASAPHREIPGQTALHLSTNKYGVFGIREALDHFFYLLDSCLPLIRLQQHKCRFFVQTMLQTEQFSGILRYQFPKCNLHL
ncbi:hypothetical protein D3C81_1803680 [compost metagenome]